MKKEHEHKLKLIASVLTDFDANIKLNKNELTIFWLLNCKSAIPTKEHENAN